MDDREEARMASHNTLSEKMQSRAVTVRFMRPRTNTRSPSLSMGHPDTFTCKRAGKREAIQPRPVTCVDASHSDSILGYVSTQDRVSSVTPGPVHAIDRSRLEADAPRSTPHMSPRTSFSTSDSISGKWNSPQSLSMKHRAIVSTLTPEHVLRASASRGPNTHSRIERLCERHSTRMAESSAASGRRPLSTISLSFLPPTALSTV
jgi:hypothetical protein